MNWTQHIESLRNGNSVVIKPKGNSMKPKIDSGNLVTIDPEISSIKKGDIVLCKVKGNYYVHLVKAIRGKQYQIGNNKGHVNGWITINAIFGKVIGVEK